MQSSVVGIVAVFVDQFAEKLDVIASCGFGQCIPTLLGLEVETLAFFAKIGDYVGATFLDRPKDGWIFVPIDSQRIDPYIIDEILDSRQVATNTGVADNRPFRVVQLFGVGAFTH